MEERAETRHALERNKVLKRLAQPDVYFSSSFGEALWYLGAQESLDRLILILILRRRLSTFAH